MEKERESKSWEEKCAELQGKNEKLVKKVTGQMFMQGDKNIIWDELILEARKLRPYLDYILEKENDIQESK